MNELQVFNNPAFGTVRTIEEDGKVLFCGSDVAEALGYSKPRSAISAHCPHALKRGVGVQTGTKVDGTPALQQVDMSFIPESDVYRLVFSSKLPTAEKFTDWVTMEILPSVRKHGAYMTQETLEAAILSPDYLLKVVTALKDETDKRRALEAQNAALNDDLEKAKPKALFADAVSASHTTILIGELAKLLHQNGVDIGQNRLFSWMRDNGYLIKHTGCDYNMPTQYSMERGWFKIKERTVQEPNGSISVKKTPLVTGKGQQYFINLFLGKNHRN